MKNFEYDYDKENDSLFIYNPETKSKGSIELDNLIIDYTTKGEISSFELLNASKLLENWGEKGIFTKEKLSQIKEVKVDIKQQQNFLKLQFFIKLAEEQTITPMLIPTITESSPAIA